MDISDVRIKAMAYSVWLRAKKAELAPADFWYPYDSFGNFTHFDNMLTGDHRDASALFGSEPIADIGAADGDTTFFLESLGYRLHIVDYAPTNKNGLNGARRLKQALNSSVEIYDTDLDSQFTLPNPHYHMVLLLGILYHLKNPFYTLETLSHLSHYCLLSTKVTRFAADRTTDLSQIPVGYLLDAFEANNDPTNYWVFSQAGLRRLLNRTGWTICDIMAAGNTVNSDPGSWEGDERIFCLLQSQHV